MSLRKFAAAAAALISVLAVVHLSYGFTAECTLAGSETSRGPSISLADQIMRSGWPGVAVLRVSLLDSTLTFPRLTSGRPISLQSSGPNSYTAGDHLVRVEVSSTRRGMTIFMGGDAPVTLFYDCN